MESVRRILLVGFMGAGKSSVGREMARILDWEFVDFDQVIEERAGVGIPEIFATRGEEAFRALEAAVGRELLSRTKVVLAPGGGWPAVEGRMESIPPGTASVWLQVSPDVALERARAEAAAMDDPGLRPLLDVERPLERVRELLAVRTPFYRRAQLAVETDSASPADVARRVLDLLKERARGGGGC